MTETGSGHPLAAPRPEAARHAGELVFPFSIASLGLAAVLAAGPFWPIYVAGGRITVGRVLLAGVIVLFLVEAFIRGRELRRLEAPAVILSCALIALLAWTAVNAAAWGCFCSGGFGGLVEIAALAILTACVGTYAPSFRGLLIVATCSGIALGALLAVAGLYPESSATAAEPESGRLSGVYGNSNALAYSVAFALPVILSGAVVAYRRRRFGTCGFLAATFVLLCAVIAETLSRGGMIGAAVAVLVAAVLLASSRRAALAIALGGAAIFAGAAALLYPHYDRHRLQAEFGGQIAALDDRDVSGWDATSTGLIPGGSAVMTNGAGGSVLRVTPTGPGQGVSFPWGTARAGSPYVLRFRARSVRGRSALHFGLEDNFFAKGPVSRSAPISRRWRALRVRWIPTSRSRAARLYVWQQHGETPFELRDVAIATLQGTAPIPVKLRGSQAEAGYADFYEREEDRYVESRRAGLELAGEALRDRPLRGLGWERFPEFAGSERDFGPVPTHNEYARFAAELGFPGFGLLAAAIFATGLGFRRQGRSPIRAPLGGMIAAGFAGLLFINALVVPAASLPLAVAMGIACSRRRRPFELGDNQVVEPR